jgi:hypothetical protein
MDEHRPTDDRARRLQVGSVLFLIGAGLAIQLHFFRSYPQPILFGDPAGYLRVGQTLQEGFARWRSGEGALDVVRSLSGTLHFVGVGLLFAIVDGTRPGDLAFFRLVLAGFNALGMLGAFQLARRLSGSFLGGVVALALAVAHPSFPTHTPRLYPDAVTGCAFVWAAWAYADGWRRRSAVRMAVSGLLLSLGLFVRVQLMSFVGALLVVVLLATALRWGRSVIGRQLVAAFLAGAAPLVLLYVALTGLAGGELTAKVAEDNFALRQYYPYGFWQFLETDGWEGPYRLKTEPYYHALEAAAHQDRDLLRSRPKQLLFTARYVANRRLESALLVLDNVYRLYDRPANPYRWDYPWPMPVQVALQRLILILALAGLAALASEDANDAAVAFVPASLAVVHGLSFPWPRYGMPALLTLIALAGAAIGWTARRWSREDRWRPLMMPAVLCAIAGLLDLAALLFGARWPEASHLLAALGVLAGLGAPFALTARLSTGRHPALVAAGLWALAGTLWVAHELRSPRWHERSVELGGEIAAVEQEIRLGAEALAALKTAPEAFVMLDLQLPRGEREGLSLEVGGQPHSGAELAPTMPRLREGTATGGRDWRGYPQWWALRLDPAALPSDAMVPLVVRVSSSAPVRLGADHWRDEAHVYEGPSFGDWPHMVAGKLEYDGDYRIPITEPLGSLDTRTLVVDAQRRRKPLRAVARIRIVTLKHDQGWQSWRSGAPSDGRAALAFSAWSGNRGDAELWVDGAPRLRFPLGSSQDFKVEAGRYRICYCAEAPRGYKPYGTYFFLAPASPTAVTLEVRFLTGMSTRPMFFIVDRRRPLSERASLLPTSCAEKGTPLLEGVGEVTDAAHNSYPEDTGRWTVDSIY